MMIKDNFKQALNSIRSARWRSLFTMTGIIIGVAAVVTVVSLGEGVKRQVVGQINRFGSDLVQIQPGKANNHNGTNRVDQFGALSFTGVSTLSEHDLDAVKKQPGVKTATSLTFLSGLISNSTEKDLADGLIIATGQDMPEIFNQKVEYGTFFKDNDQQRSTVIGTKVAEQLYGEAAPIGKTIKIRGQDFVIRGVFEKFENNQAVAGANFNSAVFISYAPTKALVGGPVYINEILARPIRADDTNQLISLISARLRSDHNNQQDFTVIKQTDSVQMVNNVVTTLTNMVGGIAAISLLVGGIGIMNIMLLVVTERTHEIGIRKAIGASNRQIGGQFLSEAIVLSLWGGIIGISLAGLANIGLRIFTNLQPVITLPTVAIATAVSVIVGIIFGVAPALKAAKKSPIEALRTL